MIGPDADFVARHSARVTLRDGTMLHIRPVLPEDRERLATGYRNLSDESRRLRFFVPLARLSPEMLEQLTVLDFVDRAGWLALVPSSTTAPDAGEVGVGVARYIRRVDRPTVAEAAVTVVDRFQGHGVGTLLLEVLTFAALDHGIQTFCGQVLRDNDRMLSVLRHAGAHFEFDDPGVLYFEDDLPSRAQELRGTSLYAVLRAAAEGQAAVD